MNKISFHAEEQLEEQLKNLLYSYERDGEHKTYEVIKYGTQYLIPSVLLATLKEGWTQIISRASQKYRSDSPLLQSPNSKILNQIIKLYRNSQIFDAQVAENKGLTTVISLIPLKRCYSSADPQFFIKSLLIYLVEALKLEYTHNVPNLTRDLSLSDVYPPNLAKYYATMYEELLQFSCDKPLPVPGFFFCSTLRDSLLYYLQTLVSRPFVKDLVPRMPLKVYTFYDILETLEFPCYNMNHLCTRGLKLLNPLGSLKAFSTDPFINKPLKKLPSKGYTCLPHCLYIWNFKDKKELRYLKNHLGQKFQIANQKIGSKYKINQILQLFTNKKVGTLIQFKKGYFIKLNPLISTL